MKNIKISLSAIALAIGVCAAFAFKSAPNHNTVKSGSTWYIFTGTDQTDRLSYTQGTPNCIGSHKLCAVQLTDHGTHPAQSDVDNIQAEINTDVSTQNTNDANVELKN